MSHKNQPSGYRQKPVWIQILAALLILAPFGNILSTFFLMDIPLTNPQSWTYWLTFIPARVWALNVLLFASGWALLKVRTWTHLLATATLLSVIVYNIMNYQSLLLLGPLTLAGFILISVITLVVLYSKEFRKPYFNPRLRWWETSPRYKARLPVILKDLPNAKDYSGELLDISRSGTLIALDPKFDHELQIGEEHHVLLPNNLEINAQVVRRNSEGYGLQFKRNSWSTRSQLKRFIQDLAKDPSRFLR